MLEELARLALDGDDVEIEDDAPVPAPGPAARHPAQAAAHPLGDPGPARPARPHGRRGGRSRPRASSPSAGARGLRCVRIVHGKGLRSRGTRAGAQAPHPQAAHAPRRGARLRRAARDRTAAAAPWSSCWKADAMSARRGSRMRRLAAHRCWRSPSGIDNLRPPARQPRRGALLRDLARDGRERRLGHAAPERRQVLREAAAAVLGDGRFASSLRRDEFAARLYVAFCGLATHPHPGLHGRAHRWVAERAWRAVLALVSSPYFMALGGIVTLDMGLTLWTTATLCAYLLAEAATMARAPRWLWLLRRLGRHGARRAVEGAGGHRLPGCRAVPALRPAARLRSAAAARVGLRARWSSSRSPRPGSSRSRTRIRSSPTSSSSTSTSRASSPRRTGASQPWWYFLPILAVGFLPWMFALPARHQPRVARRGRTRGVQPLRLALTLERLHPRSSSAPRARSCPPTSCRSSRRSPWCSGATSRGPDPAPRALVAADGVHRARPGRGRVAGPGIYARPVDRRDVRGRASLGDRGRIGPAARGHRRAVAAARRAALGGARWWLPSARHS